MGHHFFLKPKLLFLGANYVDFFPRVCYGRILLPWQNFRANMLLFAHYADRAGPQPRLWFAEQGK